MAIDPRISLAITPAINIGQRFGQNLQNLQRQDLLNTRRDLAPIQLQQAQRANELQQAQQPALLQQAEFEAGSGSQLANQQQQSEQIATSYARSLRPLLGDPQALTGELQRQKAQFQQAGVDTSGIDEDILQAQTPEGLALLAKAVNTALAPASSRVKSTGQREYENYVRIAQDANATELERNSANRALGNLAKAGSSAQERIAKDDELGRQVVEQKGAESSVAEGGKLKQQLKYKPAIARAVRLAEKAATEQGDVLTDLARAEAGLPGLIEATDNLKELASVATSTLGGRFFDVIAKESGWGTTKGANAKAKYIAIIDNQVLPLLKQTFGGAMTEGEGLRLSNTFGDPNASPEQKMLQTEAFIEQKLRDIERLKTQSEAGATAADKTFNFDAQGNLIE
jgi:hypothetical protein